MDLDLLRRFLTDHCEWGSAGYLVRKTDQKRVKSVMPVHTLGDVGDISALLSIADEFGLVIIEDSTEALGSSYRGKPAGCFGLAGTFSFNGNKIITTGGGGMIVTDNEDFANRAKHLSTQAKDASKGYYHDDVGYNYRLVNVLAAIGVAQLEQLPDILIRKREIANRYRAELANVGDISFPQKHPDVLANSWLNTFRTDNRDELLASLADKQIEARPFWVPMNQLPMYANNEYVHRDDVSNYLYSGCVSVPSSANLTDDQQSTVIDAIRSVYV